MTPQTESTHDLLQRLSLCTEGSGIGTWERDLLTGAGRWNRTLWDINRRPYRDPPAPSRDEVADMYHPADREAVARAWQRILQGEPDVAFEHRIIRGDGSIGWILSRGRVECDASGRAVRMFGNTIDVTDLHEARLRLDEARANLETASDAAGLGIWQRDLRSGEGQWNARLLALHGLDPSRPTPDRHVVPTLLHPEDRAAWREAFEFDPVAGSASIDVQYRVPAPGGAWRWLQARGRTICDEAGRPVRQMGVTFDITRQREADLALQAKELAERASSAKTEFLSRVSHELRTPLNAVTGFAQLLLIDPREPLSDSQRATLQQIDSAAWHLLALIDDVLDLSRVESGHARIQPAAVVLPPLIDECISLCRRDAEARAIDIRIDGVTPGLPEAWCDRTRTKPVLVNLLSNAVKYNREGGHIVVQAERGVDGLPHVRVIDTGLGLSAEQRAQLFQPFNRLGREGSDIEGTGVGLALSKSLVDQMGGRLEVDSQLGVGSVFELVLPTVPAAAEHRLPFATRPAPMHPITSGTGRVLVVDDVATNVEVLLKLLEMRPGLEVKVASTGAAALETAIRWCPDVALIDLRLPDIDGIDLAARLRRLPGWRHTRMVCVSANVAADAVSRAMQSGFADFWSKPLQATRTLQSLDRLLRQDASASWT